MTSPHPDFVKAGQIAAARIGRSQGTEKADTKGQVKFQAKAAVTGGTLRELLSGLNDQQLVRILMKINPQELLRTVEIGKEIRERSRHKLATS